MLVDWVDKLFSDKLGMRVWTGYSWSHWTLHWNKHDSERASQNPGACLSERVFAGRILLVKLVHCGLVLSL